MAKTLLRLYPLPPEEVSLEGIHLYAGLPAKPAFERAFVYSNYVTSLDGRIAVSHHTKSGLTVPEQIVNDRDWRLFQELAVQADVIISSGRYLRDYADGRSQEILNVYEDAHFADLGEWRLKQGLPRYPTLAIISASLSFPIPNVLASGTRQILVFTHDQADKERQQQLKENINVSLYVAGKNGKVEGKQLISILSKLGYRRVYNATGPKVLHLLLADGVLDRLYLTFAHRLLGGEQYSTIVEGFPLFPPSDFKLTALYLDTHALNGSGQLFAQYDFVNPAN